MRRGVACLIFILAIWSSPADSEGLVSADQLLKLEGDEFGQAASDMSYGLDGSDYSADQLIAIAEKLLPRVVAIGVKGYDNHNPFGLYFSAACEKATYKQLDALIDLYSRIDPGSFEKIDALPRLAARWIERETNAIHDKDRHFALPATVDDSSGKFSNAPKDLVDGFRKYAGIKAAYEKAFPAPDEKIDAYANRKSFYEIVTAALRGDTDRENELLKYAWTGANCMNVTDVEDAQDIAMLLMLLRERRLDLAVGACLRVITTEGSTSQPQTTAGPIIKLFRMIGVDWEIILAGAELDRIARPAGVSDREPGVELLAAYSSDRGGILLNQLAHFAGKGWRSEFVSAFDSFIPKDPSAKQVDQEIHYGHAISRDAAQPISRKVQELSLHTVEEFAVPDLPEESAGEAVSIFARTQQRSSIPALRLLTQHPSRGVSDRAVAVLSAMGEEAPITNSEPVSFRILINNEPLPAGKTIHWQVEHRDGSRISSSIDSETDGLVKLDRGHFVGVSSPVRVTFNGSHKTSDSEFTADIRPPSDLGRVTSVSIQASTLQIVLANLYGLNAPFDGHASLWLQPHSENEMSEPYLSSWNKHDVAADPLITLPNVQHGLYDVWIAVTGAEMWHQIIEVIPRMHPIEAVLKPGSDVRFSVVGPYGEMPHLGRLIRDGQPFKPQFDRDSGYRFLSCGNYILVLPGSEVLDGRELKRGVARGPDEVPFSGKQVPFTIAKGSPAVIDLGQIRLEALSH